MLHRYWRMRSSRFIRRCIRASAERLCKCKGDQSSTTKITLQSSLYGVGKKFLFRCRELAILVTVSFPTIEPVTVKRGKQPAFRFTSLYHNLRWISTVAFLSTHVNVCETYVRIKVPICNATLFFRYLHTLPTHIGTQQL